MTREERIALNKSLGLSVEWLEAMTDDEYEAERDFREEKALRRRHARLVLSRFQAGYVVRAWIK
jgi:hypothetical protein